jgi:hypothetical protein
MKQETIEETADKYVAKNKMYFDTPYEKAHSRVAFIAGAKWQAERMYSEEELDYDKIKEALVEMRKIPMSFVPDKIMYSEEEVLELCKKSRDEGYDENTLERIGANEKIVPFGDWFEQFKKK